jgi:hypothetical protein
VVGESEGDRGADLDFFIRQDTPVGLFQTRLDGFKLLSSVQIHDNIPTSGSRQILFHSIK